MLFSKIFLSIALAGASVSALPVEENGVAVELEARATEVTCNPKNNQSGAKFKVDMSYATEQAKKAAFTTGKSGDPHNYRNGDNLQWGVKGCNVKNAKLWEYPIYWNDKKVNGKMPEWQKDAQSNGQAKTPLRVVYIVDNGTHDKRPKVCGVMTHSTVDKEFQGKDFFQKCT
ncbi:Ribonuclease/ribotoxin [Annulohypoxylon maeteangense]|uniref:Ribonuclease/ribotoxin n=1 Tax=Annulohypoxylon maeteangense TaxID=1927788 RepID=UPI0020077A8E|nr:Ribonuclease/ribotoxin [Annulohypoxylon maeteangense]KAI0888558.1 Ribonuclease/ribotoxin [Annulohypoxylon maeteangense]